MLLCDPLQHCSYLTVSPVKTLANLPFCGLQRGRKLSNSCGFGTCDSGCDEKNRCRLWGTMNGGVTSWIVEGALVYSVPSARFQAFTWRERQWLSRCSSLDWRRCLSRPTDEIDPKGPCHIYIFRKCRATVLSFPPARRSTSRSSKPRAATSCFQFLPIVSVKAGKLPWHKIMEWWQI